MRKLIIAALAATTLAGAASAQETCEKRSQNRTIGTVAGAGVGAILGKVIGGDTLGTVLGAVAGGVAGNQIERGPQDCTHAYGYYDNGSQWHANRVDPAAATGFYDRDGRWVTGAPAGYYDRNGQWVKTDASRGYRDRNGYWVPAGASGYYAADGSYVTAQPGTQQGYVDPRYANNDPRYANNDPRYTNTDPRYATSDPRYANNDPRGYSNDRDGVDPRDYRGRIARIGQRIDRAVSDGSMTSTQAYRARRDLASVNRLAAAYPHYRDGSLSARNQQVVNARLDTIDGRLRQTRAEARNY
jgi:hypothetical protein